MLTKFSVKNYKQFKDTITFDLSASNYSFNEDCVKNKTVKTALIYGANSTGKTNLGMAMFDLVTHLTDNESDRLDESYYKSLNSDEAIIEFEFHFIFDNKKVVYQYTKDENRKLLTENLYIDDMLIINYQLNKSVETNLQGAESLNKKMNPKQNLSALKYIFRNTVLDKRNQNNKIFIMLMEFINNILWYRNVADDRGYIGCQRGTTNIFESIIDNGNLENFEMFLNNSGIDCSLCDIDLNGKTSIGFKINGKEIPFQQIASTGTMNLALFYFWWQQVPQVPLLFIDEFDASYHFKLSESIVKKLKELKNTQVILTTHNTNLLNTDLIRPDCGFIIDGVKIKALQHCTKRELRYAHNLEKMYKAGAFNVE